MTIDFGKVAVLYGGESCEREVSLLSGKEVFDALISRGVDAHLVDTKDHQAVLNLKKNGFDRTFVMLHGKGGEDGQIQAVLDFIGIAFTGSEMTACAIAMDKVLTKRVWKAYGLPVLPEMLLTDSTTYAELVQKLNAKIFAIKPTEDGSSLGVSRVTNQEQLIEARKKLTGRSDAIMAEPWIEGRELTYGIVGENVLPGIEIAPSKEHVFYDYQAKYVANDISYVCPPNLPEDLLKQLENLSKQGFETLGARGWGRVDFMLDEFNQPWMLEINLAPGMTTHSLVPLAARHVGMSFADIVMMILEQTLNK